MARALSQKAQFRGGIWTAVAEWHLFVASFQTCELVAKGRLRFRTMRYLHNSGRNTCGWGAVDNTVSSKLRIIPKGEESRNEVGESDSIVQVCLMEMRKGA